MDCGSCADLIPDDSIFCPECGARQEISRAGSFANTGSVGLGGQEVTGGRNFGVVSGEAVRQQREMGQGPAGGLPPEVLQQIAMGVNSNKISLKVNTLLNKGCPQIKWASIHLNKGCLPTKWASIHLNRGCLPIKWVNTLLKANLL